MTSPFPGMDPYLEGNWWTSFHAYLAPEIAAQLNPRLRPKYIAVPERKYVTGTLEEIMICTDSMIPDVGVRKTRGLFPHDWATAVATQPLRLRSSAPTAVPHFRIHIRDTKNRKLVTAIELLSPTNKRSGRRAYLRKRQHFLQSPVHLLEIDLHHQGRRMPLLEPYPPGAYFVLLNRAKRRSWTEVRPASLDQPLPTVLVPLLKGDPDIPLNLQTAFSKVYEIGNFDTVLNYTEPPDVELSSEELAWLDTRLREVGFR